MRAVEESKLPVDSSTFKLHIDRCLGCRACEPVCPAGVQYGQLLEASRAELFGADKQRGFTHRCLRLVLRHVWLHPGRLRFAFAVARMFRDSGVAGLLVKSRIPRLLSRRFEFALALLDSSSPVSLGSDTDIDSLKRSPTGPKVDAKLTTLQCSSQVVWARTISRVNKATARVLNVNGFGTSVPKTGCCGALHAHAGDLEGARTLARRNIEASTIPESPNPHQCRRLWSDARDLWPLLSDDAFRGTGTQVQSRVRDVSNSWKCEVERGLRPAIGNDHV